MKSVKRSVCTAALFVGSVVGAGFATGQEVSLFFGKDGMLSLVVTALFMAACVFAFMSLGAKGQAGEGSLGFAADAGVTVCSFAVYAAMIAAAEELLAGLTGRQGLSVLVAVGMIFLSGEKRASLSLLNLIAVPLMAVIVVLVGAKAGGEVTGAFRPIPALCYGGMNLLFSGALLRREGEGSTLGERIGASLLSGAVVFVMLLFMRRCVAEQGGDMPFLAAADGVGLGMVAQLTLLLAVVTTMASCAYLATDFLARLSGDRVFAAPTVALLGILLSGFGFAPIVRATYPAVSYLGLAATLFALGAPVAAFFKKRSTAREHSH